MKIIFLVPASDGRLWGRDVLFAPRGNVGKKHGSYVGLGKNKQEEMCAHDSGGEEGGSANKYLYYMLIVATDI